MFWVILVVGFLVYLFFSTKREQVNKVKVQGGFYFKYKVLLDYFFSMPGIQIERKSSTSVILALKDKYVVTRYTISHGFEDVSVFFHQRSVTFGEHSLSWNFPDTMSQSQMINVIEKELEFYYKNLMS